jgi:hypothetical protein
MVSMQPIALSNINKLAPAITQLVAAITQPLIKRVVETLIALGRIVMASVTSLAK